MTTLMFVMGFILLVIVWLFVEFMHEKNLNDFLDEKIMRRTVWLWLPFYALWRMSKEVIFNDKK